MTDHVTMESKSSNLLSRSWRDTRRIVDEFFLETHKDFLFPEKKRNEMTA